ncbi:sodium:proton antiporter [Oscillatoria sp. FACHB-1407]|uniref:cation:proton antiporter n=1 Tax=Oscillatoria sp. FACHB-1407 TaxID=2692847 RepID=UPI001686EC1F|nr:sodium:proton antiporter [Oscillatoria sp. FACHB-1407]MBD2465157.1 sodium:proton antiporter [Oscillatoria sp. FACHB-1407]
MTFIPVIAATQDHGAVAGLVTILIILLLVATGVALLSRRLRLPYVTGLVLAGLAIADLLPERIGLDSALILNLFLPILLFEAAINTDLSRLRSTVKPVSLLAGPGVILCAGITAIALKFTLGWNWIQVLILGVILAITDTVSVIAVFKEVNVPSRLSTIVEGESLFNDGMALVLFSLILQAHATGSITVADSIQQFLLVIAGGALLGLILGYLSAELFSRSDDPLSGILLTVALALGAFQAAESIHVSGVVTVVVAGLVVGNTGLTRRFSASSRITLYSFWEYAGFGVNTFIFLLIGLEINLTTLWQTLPAVLVAIAAYQVGRLLSVYPLLAILQRFDRPIPLRWQHVLFLGNIKGSLSMALALSLPATLSGRGDLIALVYGTVLLSLIGQGLSLPWLVKQLNISPVPASLQQVEELQAQLITAKAAQDTLDELLKNGILPKAVYEEMRSRYQVQVAKSEKLLREHYNLRSDPGAIEKSDRPKLDAIRRQLLLAEKGALNQALRRRVISDTVGRSQLQKIDEQLLSLEDD